jgi:hypothetical protein
MSKLNIDNQKISELSKMCSELRSIRNKIDELKKQLETTKNDESRIATEIIPAIMSDIGVSELKLSDGSSVRLKTNYFSSIPDDRRDEAMRWLRENNFEDLIRNEVTFPFTVGQDEVAQSLEKFIKTNEKFRDLILNKKQTVNAMQMKAFLKEQTEMGKHVPDDLFGIYVQTTTIMKEPETK